MANCNASGRMQKNKKKRGRVVSFSEMATEWVYELDFGAIKL